MTPAALPEARSPRGRYGELITETVLVVLVASLILLSPSVSTETDADGRPIGLLSPWLFDTGAVYVFIGLMVASLLVAYANHYRRWNWPLAVGGSLVQLAGPVMLLWLAVNGRVVNPVFVGAGRLVAGDGQYGLLWTGRRGHPHGRPHHRRHRPPDRAQGPKPRPAPAG